ncbi:chemotaxis response regulator protein-glutamate methylesterase [Novosphingobium sp. PS1R-30]|uniref:Protein-glutamate methylesterase/protein-glutamine glutaminase n=1 Tax=Novosphingobium anseongense TaxID=3133436 RepID=A0ABU8RQL6_9SPHN|nr:MAG: chemotaxis response regulator protein-glutamate methylesterase [Novosphingobium sp.]
MTIRVLIVDDSATMRAILAACLSAEPDIQVVGSAGNAAEGRELMKVHNPDVVTLDIEMPGMNGLDFLEKIMTLRPTPVIIVSGSTQQGAETTARALTLGAIDCYAKADLDAALRTGARTKLGDMIRQAAQVQFNRGGASAPAPVAARTNNAIRAHRPDLIAIGSSTGGVEALQTVLANFPADCPPTVIVQHVNPRFAPAIAKTLDISSPATVMLAEPDMPLKPGHCYLAPGDDRHLTVGGTAGKYYARLRPGNPVSGHLPSVDMLFGSVAQTVGPRAVGALLTGMGSDGARGLLAMSQAGAATIAQDEATCTVFGMPRAAISLGAAGVIAPIGEIATYALGKAA